MIQPPGQPMYPGRPFAVPRNDLGITSLWLGISAAVLFWLPAVGLGLGIAAIATGIAAWMRIRRGQAANKGVTVTGIVLGILVSIVGTVVLAASIFLISMFISYENCIDHAQGRGEYAQC